MSERASERFLACGFSSCAGSWKFCLVFRPPRRDPALSTDNVLKCRAAGGGPMRGTARNVLGRVVRVRDEGT